MWSHSFIVHMGETIAQKESRQMGVKCWHWTQTVGKCFSFQLVTLVLQWQRSAKSTWESAGPVVDADCHLTLLNAPVLPCWESSCQKTISHSPSSLWSAGQTILGAPDPLGFGWLLPALEHIGVTSIPKRQKEKLVQSCGFWVICNHGKRWPSVRPPILHLLRK